MAHDRFVRWTSARRPTQDDLRRSLEDYLGPVATKIKWDHDRFFVTIPGIPTSPLKQQVDAPAWATRDRDARYDPVERWFEVWIGDDSVDVMTRAQDELVNAIADGYAAFCARWWDGTIEQ